MPRQAGGKGNPASHRMSNPRRKARRERSWQRGQERKRANSLTNELRAKHNRELRGSGQLTAWEVAQQKRAERRAA